MPSASLFEQNTLCRSHANPQSPQTFDLVLSAALPSTPVVAEVQAGLRLAPNFHAVAEYRRTDFRIGNKENLAAGIQYQFRSWTWRPRSLDHPPGAESGARQGVEVPIS